MQEAYQKSVRAAVIGAGMAGLVAARELLRENHEVVIFEKSDQIGGTWVYDPRTETDPMGLDPTREIVHSSMFESLRTNLPRHLMGFLDYPFTPKESSEDPRTFPGREEVLRFLNDFAADFDLIKLVRFGSDVVRVEQVDTNKWNSNWTVEWRTPGAAASTVEDFDAVVVCNGHYTQPRLADFPGRSSWPGKQVHSHNYRIPEPYKDQIVVIIGNGQSAIDISINILPFAKEVHQASRGTQNPDRVQLNFKSCAGILQHPMIKCAEEDGKLVFEDGSSLYPDVLLHCTGYSYDFPFLKTHLVTVDDNRVGPLYQHIYPASEVAPYLSFIGLTYNDTPPLVIELQSKWVARVLRLKMLMAGEEYMLLVAQQFYDELEEMGWPKHHTHRLQMDKKFGYEKWIHYLIYDLPDLEEWKVEMFFALSFLPAEYGVNWRDKWDADKWIQEFEQRRLAKLEE